MKHRSEALSIYKTFSAMVRTHFDTSIRIFRADSTGEYLSDALVRFFLSKALLLSFLVLVLMLRMALLSASIVIFLRRLVLFCSPLLFLLIFGLRLSLPPLF